MGKLSLVLCCFDHNLARVACEEIVIKAEFKNENYAWINLNVRRLLVSPTVWCAW